MITPHEESGVDQINEKIKFNRENNIKVELKKICFNFCFCSYILRKL